jgi:hypothetical protein
MSDEDTINNIDDGTSDIDLVCYENPFSDSAENIFQWADDIQLYRLTELTGVQITDANLEDCIGNVTMAIWWDHFDWILDCEFANTFT